MKRLLACVLLVAATIQVDTLNDRPIVGILTQPFYTGFPTNHTAHPSYEQSYIAASYVKWIESAGARVAPVHFEGSAEALARLFRQINGLVFPGGGSNITRGTRLRSSAETLLSLALRANDQGDFFPVWGTCEGHELLWELIGSRGGSTTPTLCSGCYDADGLPLPLDLTPMAVEASLFADMPRSLLTGVQEHNLTANFHQNGVSPNTWRNNTKLFSFFDVLSTNVDKRQRAFVSTATARQYPFTSVQWHPEKNNFEWLVPGIPHGAEATALSQYTANFFVNQVRQSSHRFSDLEHEKAALIYRSTAENDPNGYFEEVYVWNVTSIDPRSASIGLPSAQSSQHGMIASE